MILVYIPCRSKKEAETISKHLLKHKLIACANIIPTTSFYTWKNKLNKCSETLLLAKTSDKNYNKIKQETTKLHSYDIPAIIKISAEANKSYSDWVKKQL